MSRDMSHRMSHYMPRRISRHMSPFSAPGVFLSHVGVILSTIWGGFILRFVWEEVGRGVLITCFWEVLSSLLRGDMDHLYVNREPQAKDRLLHVYVHTPTLFWPTL